MMPASSPVPFFILLVVLSVIPTGCPADTVEVSPDYLDVNCTIPDGHENKVLHLNKALENYTHDTILVLNKPGCFKLQDIVLVETSWTIQSWEMVQLMTRLHIAASWNKNKNNKKSSLKRTSVIRNAIKDSNKL